MHHSGWDSLTLVDSDPIRISSAMSSSLCSNSVDQPFQKWDQPLPTVTQECISISQNQFQLLHQPIRMHTEPLLQENQEIRHTSTSSHGTKEEAPGPPLSVAVPIRPHLAPSVKYMAEKHGSRATRSQQSVIRRKENGTFPISKTPLRNEGGFLLISDHSLPTIVLIIRVELRSRNSHDFRTTEIPINKCYILFHETHGQSIFVF